MSKSVNSIKNPDFFIASKYTFIPVDTLLHILDVGHSGAFPLRELGGRCITLVEQSDKWRIDRKGNQEAPHIDFFWIIEGTMRVESYFGVQDATPGMLLIIPAHFDRRQTIITPHCKYLYFRTDIPSVFPQIDRIILKESQCANEIIFYVNRIIDDENRTIPGAKTEVSNDYRLHLFSLIAELIRHEAKAEIVRTGNPLELFLQKAGNVSQNTTVEEYAKKLNLSLSAFFKRCVAETGFSPKEFIQRQRLQRAQSLLKYSEYTISDIALQVGYANAFSFSKAFRKATGQSPKEYRETSR